MSDVVIIKLMLEQWQRYREIRLESLREEPQAFGTSFAEMEQKPDSFWQGRLADALRGEKSWLVFAQQDERLIGMIGAFYDEAQDSAHIVSVYVRKTERGKGVGKELMRGILNEIEKKEFIHKATLGVNQEQKTAVKLYQQFGFKVTGEGEEIQGDGLKHHGFLMEKRLK